MDTNYLIKQLDQAGWQYVGPNRHANIEFDLVGSRKFVTKWYILVKFMSAFDAETLPTWQDNFKTLDELSKSWVLGECFLLCLIAKQVSPSLIKGDKFGQVGLMRLQGGGGRVLIADELNHQVYGEVPRLPLDAHKFTKSTKDILMGGFS